MTSFRLGLGVFSEQLQRYDPGSINAPLTQRYGPQTLTMAFAWKAAGLTYVRLCIVLARYLTISSYNRYLAVAARVVRRSLKEEQRLQAERRGQMDLRFAKWQVSSRLQSDHDGVFAPC
jgi:hypothetical protein